MTADQPSGAYEMARRAAEADIAEWLERCVGDVPLWNRVEIAARLRDGTWRQDKPMPGLREHVLQVRRAEVLAQRGVALDDMPGETRQAVLVERARRKARRERERAEVDRLTAEMLGR